MTEAIGYFWGNCLLLKRHTDETHGSVDLILVPRSKKGTVIRFVHDKLGHGGHKPLSGAILCGPE